MLFPVNTKGSLGLGGEVGRLIDNFNRNWLISVPETNPSILSVYRERDRLPYRHLLPWTGEFAGKYITGAYYIYKITRSQELYRTVLSFADSLLECQDDDGYLGCFCKSARMTGRNSFGEAGTWDAWNHYHIMYGLYLWYGETGREEYLRAVTAAADMFISMFYGDKMRLKDMGSTETNLACLHIFALLYGDTGEKKYLDFAEQIALDVESPEGGGYISCMDSGEEFYRCRKPRWESLHVIMGINTLGLVTENEKLCDTAKKVLYSILRTDVHNTGGFSTREAAVGTPFDNGAVELCCVIAFNALCTDIYRQSGDLHLADFLELSYYNAIMGSYSPSGRWSTYNTPMDGVKIANYNEIGFQARAGSPDLNCCSANSGRGLGQLYDWAFVRDGENIIINYYGDCDFETEEGIKISVCGNYPENSRVRLRFICPEKTEILLRIPHWSKNTSVNGKAATPGEYFPLLCPAGESEALLEFDFSLRFEYGREAYEGKRSVFRGPVLFGYDLSENDMDLTLQKPVDDADFDGAEELVYKKDGKLLMKLKCGLVLCGFYRLGSEGSEYRTWI